MKRTFLKLNLLTPVGVSGSVQGLRYIIFLVLCNAGAFEGSNAEYIRGIFASDPVNSFEFHPCERTFQAGCLTR